MFGNKFHFKRRNLKNVVWKVNVLHAVEQCANFESNILKEVWIGNKKYQI